MVVFARMMAEDNSSQLITLREQLGRALREEVTDRQRQILFLYYGEGMTMRQIAEALGLERSSVSRTLKRGEERIRRSMRYADRSLLRSGAIHRPVNRH